jgi:hypothetical protein
MATTLVIEQDGQCSDAPGQAKGKRQERNNSFRFQRVSSRRLEWLVNRIGIHGNPPTTQADILITAYQLTNGCFVYSPLQRTHSKASFRTFNSGSTVKTSGVSHFWW